MKFFLKLSLPSHPVRLTDTAHTRFAVTRWTSARAIQYVGARVPLIASRRLVNNNADDGGGGGGPRVISMRSTRAVWQIAVCGRRRVADPSNDNVRLWRYMHARTHLWLMDIYHTGKRSRCPTPVGRTAHRYCVLLLLLLREPQYRQRCRRGATRTQQDK